MSSQYQTSAIGNKYDVDEKSERRERTLCKGVCVCARYARILCRLTPSPDLCGSVMDTQIKNSLACRVNVDCMEVLKIMYKMKSESL